MTIVGGLDVHRAQITFDYLDCDSGEVTGGQIRPATRQVIRTWLADRFPQPDHVAFAVEGCTGWRFVAEELARAGVEVHVAEPADTATLRGKKKRAKTDRADARHLRQLLVQHRLPESWVPPLHVLETRTLGRLYIAVMNQRRAWQQRIHAHLFHQGCPPVPSVLTAKGRASVAAADLSPAGRQAVQLAYRAIDQLSAEADPLRAQLRHTALRLYGCRALMEALFGIGTLTAPIVWSEMGDTRRFANADCAVRHTGLDVTVWSSDGKRSPGHLARQGPPALRWALFEAAHLAARPSSPDHAYYASVRDRRGPNRAALSVARKLARRSHHILRDLGDRAWAEPA